MSWTAALERAIDARLDAVPGRELSAAAATLSARYREGSTPVAVAVAAAMPTRGARAGAGVNADARALSNRALWSDMERLAYLVVRAPATGAAVRAVLRELLARLTSAGLAFAGWAAAAAAAAAADAATAAAGPSPDPAVAFASAAASASSRELTIRSLLDLGAGPGVGLWAALDLFDTLEHATLVERDAASIALGQALAHDAGLDDRLTISWRRGDLRHDWRTAPAANDRVDPIALPPAAHGTLPQDARPAAHRSRPDDQRRMPQTPAAAAAAGPVTTVAARAANAEAMSREIAPHDLVLLSYSVGELDDGAALALIDRAWQLSRVALVIVEPGTPRHFARVRALRQRLIDAGARIVAPCPHDRACPMAAPDWCHFAARLGRSSLHRRLKQGALSYEDEKFSYIVALRAPQSQARPEVGAEASRAAQSAVRPAAARIVRRPEYHKGFVRLPLCSRAGAGAGAGGSGEAAEGLRVETVTRSQRAAYRAARDAAWGDAWEPPSTEPEATTAD